MLAYPSSVELSELMMRMKGLDCTLKYCADAVAARATRVMIADLMLNA